MTLYNKFMSNCGMVSDIYEHLPKLYEYGRKVNHITEFGVRTGISTSAFLAAKPSKLRSYDINRDEQVNELVDLAKQEGADFLYLIDNSNTVDIEDTDLLFIDSEHTEGNTLREFKNAAHKVNKYMIFHDSNYPCPLSPSVRTAIDKFLKENKNWIILEEFDNNNGLLIIGNSNNL